MAQNNVIDEVAWVVGDEAIWKSEVEEARLSALYEGRKFDKDPYCVLPEEMAVQKLFLHQAVLLLSGVIVAETRKYLWNGRLDDESGEEPPTL